MFYFTCDRSFSPAYKAGSLHTPLSYASPARNPHIGRSHISVKPTKRPLPMSAVPVLFGIWGHTTTRVVNKQLNVYSFSCLPCRQSADASEYHAIIVVITHFGPCPPAEPLTLPWPPCPSIKNEVSYPSGVWGRAPSCKRFLDVLCAILRVS